MLDLPKVNEHLRTHARTHPEARFSVVRIFMYAVKAIQHIPEEKQVAYT